MAKKFDIGVRKNIKKKKTSTFAFAVRVVFSACVTLISLLTFLYLFFNKDALIKDEKADLGILKIPISQTTIVIIFIVLLLVMCVSLYLSIIALFEHIRKIKHPSDVEKQIELIESQFTEKEKKVYISSKEKLKQLENAEKEKQKRLNEKYGDGKK